MCLEHARIVLLTLLLLAGCAQPNKGTDPGAAGLSAQQQLMSDPGGVTIAHSNCAPKGGSTAQPPFNPDNQITRIYHVR